MLQDYFGYDVVYCMNITDIDDKVRAYRVNISDINDCSCNYIVNLLNYAIFKYIESFSNMHERINGQRIT